ncbi:MAG: hypothetical protein SPG61_01635 [Arcanobacterium sp.]|nr:hypothetical protein [Arcanobacterium sp.]
MRKSVSLAVILVAGLGLSACASEAALPKPVIDRSVETIVDEAKFADLLTSVKKSVEAADSANTVKELGANVAGPIRTQREAQYKLKSILGDSYKLPSIVIDPEATLIASGTAYPRTVATIAAPTGDQNFQTLNVWNQASVRENYKLWGQAYLFPGLDLPALKSNLDDTAGYPEVDVAKYAADPAALLENYAQYLNGAEAKVKFAEDDAILTQITAQKDRLTKAVADLATVSIKSAASKNGFKVIPTEDNGLIVVGEVDYQLSVDRQDEEATLRLRGEIGALGTGKADGVLDVKKKLTAKYSLLTAFYVPAAGSDAQVQVIGAASPTLLSVTNE